MLHVNMRVSCTETHIALKWTTCGILDRNGIGSRQILSSQIAYEIRLDIMSRTNIYDTVSNSQGALPSSSYWRAYTDLHLSSTQRGMFSSSCLPCHSKIVFSTATLYLNGADYFWWEYVPITKYSLDICRHQRQVCVTHGLNFLDGVEWSLLHNVCEDGVGIVVQCADELQ